MGCSRRRQSQAGLGKKLLFTVIIIIFIIIIIVIIIIIIIIIIVVLLLSFSINLPEFYHKCCSLIGFPTHHLFGDR